ncbi:MAG: phospho-N-acetylmuramoyl-pentapeptide-transferase [Chloroflexota bacterium]|nr:phospho-N-acetylmuramoyl-pentapeptide-transferase [Chloroflexota bacterium]
MIAALLRTKGHPLMLAALAFAIVVPWGGWFVRQLRRYGVGKHIRADGPSSHEEKEGTPTMGGVYILVGAGSFAIVLAVDGCLESLLVFLPMVVFGALGAFDDVRGLHDQEGVGWLARSKFPAQWALALLLALFTYWVRPNMSVLLPASEHVLNLGIWLVPVYTLLVVATSNAVNLTDGLDGLAGGLSAIGFGAYGVLAMERGRYSLASFCFVLLGVLLAFLWFNVHPAAVFMGDTGSQALGAGMAAVALFSDYVLLLPLVGFVFVVEALSVILQVVYYKYTRRKVGEGQRVLRMAPLHHHYELGGLSEVCIVSRMWIVGLVAALLAVGWGVTWR